MMLTALLAAAPAAMAQTAPELSKYISLGVPTSLDCDATSAKTMFGKGLVVVGLNLHSDLITVNEQSTAKITMAYNGTQISALSLKADDGQVMILGVGALDDGDDLPEYAAQNTLYMMFGSYDDSGNDKFCKDGKYTVTIPDGALLLADAPMTGTTLTYNYTDVEQTEFDYTISPDPAVELVGPVWNLLSKITLTFPDATLVTYDKKAGGHLKTPKGVEIPSMTPGIDYGTKSIEFRFGNKSTDWNGDDFGYGAYQFTVDPGYIAVNDPAWEAVEYDGLGNFKGFTVVYNIKSEGGAPSAVTLVGIEAADLYTVYNLNGQALIVNGAPEELLGLTPGLYIINGQKVLVK